LVTVQRAERAKRAELDDADERSCSATGMLSDLLAEGRIAVENLAFCVNCEGDPKNDWDFFVHYM